MNLRCVPIRQLFQLCSIEGFGYERPRTAISGVSKAHSTPQKTKTKNEAMHITETGNHSQYHKFMAANSQG